MSPYTSYDSEATAFTGVSIGGRRRWPSGGDSRFNGRESWFSIDPAKPTVFTSLKRNTCGQRWRSYRRWPTGLWGIERERRDHRASCRHPERGRRHLLGDTAIPSTTAAYPM